MILFKKLRADAIERYAPRPMQQVLTCMCTRAGRDRTRQNLGAQRDCHGDPCGLGWAGLATVWSGVQAWHRHVGRCD